ncbi:PAP/25A associated domain protein, partial [Ostertagia ostertagi]
TIPCARFRNTNKDRPVGGVTAQQPPPRVQGIALANRSFVNAIMAVQHLPPPPIFRPVEENAGDGVCYKFTDFPIEMDDTVFNVMGRYWALLMLQVALLHVPRFNMIFIRVKWIGAPCSPMCAMISFGSTENEMRVAVEECASNLERYERAARNGGRCPISKCSQKYLESHHIQVIDKRINERKDLLERMPPMSDNQLKAINILIAQMLQDKSENGRGPLWQQHMEVATKMSDILNRHVFEKMGVTGQVAVYGSVLTRTCIENSDLNVAIDIPAVDCSDAVETMKSVADHLKVAPDVLDVQFSTDIPMCIKLTLSDVRVRIAWRCENGVKYAKLLSVYTTVRPQFAELCRIVRKWAEVSGIYSSDRRKNGLTTYGFDIMVLYFLQQKGLLPCLHEVGLQMEKIGIPEEPWNLAQLFVDFLCFYGSRVHQNEVVQVYTAKHVIKDRSRWSRKLLQICDPFRTDNVVTFTKAYQDDEYTAAADELAEEDEEVAKIRKQIYQDMMPVPQHLGVVLDARRSNGRRQLVDNNQHRSSIKQFGKFNPKYCCLQLSGSYPIRRLRERLTEVKAIPKTSVIVLFGFDGDKEAKEKDVPGLAESCEALGLTLWKGFYDEGLEKSRNMIASCPNDEFVQVVDEVALETLENINSRADLVKVALKVTGAQTMPEALENSGPGRAERARRLAENMERNERKREGKIRRAERRRIEKEQVRRVLMQIVENVSEERTVQEEKDGSAVITEKKLLAKEPEQYENGEQSVECEVNNDMAEKKRGRKRGTKGGRKRNKRHTVEDDVKIILEKLIREVSEASSVIEEEQDAVDGEQQINRGSFIATGNSHTTSNEKLCEEETSTVHDIRLKDLTPENVEIDDYMVYSRRTMHRIRDRNPTRIPRHVYMVLEEKHGLAKREFKERDKELDELLRLRREKIRHEQKRERLRAQISKRVDNDVDQVGKDLENCNPFDDVRSGVTEEDWMMSQDEESVSINAEIETINDESIDEPMETTEKAEAAEVDKVIEIPEVEEKGPKSQICYENFFITLKEFDAQSLKQKKPDIVCSFCESSDHWSDVCPLM